MSKQIDERVVSLQFNNKEFESGIEKSQKSIENLNKSIDNAGSGGGMNGFSIAIESTASKFSALGTIGFTILQNLTNSAIDAGKSIASALTTPIIEGGITRSMNIEQAKFQFKGLGMDVEATMADASYAVDGTAYSLDAAAKVAGQLGASGMRAGDEMRSSLRAISGVAAMAGSSYEDVGNIFTKVAGQGRLMGDDLLRMSSRGINAAATIANEMDKTEKEVRELVTKGEIDFQTFANAMDSAFGEHATAANETFTGSLANVKSALGRIGADVATPAMENLIGVFNAFRPLVNDVHKALGPVTDELAKLMEIMSKATIAKLEGVDLSPLKDGIESGIATIKELWPVTKETVSNVLSIFGNLRDGISSVLSPMASAFENVFPVPKSLKEVVELVRDFTSKLADMTSGMTLSSASSENLQRIFQGLFSVLDLGVQAAGFLGKVLVEVAGYLAPVGAKALEVGAFIGDMATDINNAVRESGLLQSAFSFLQDVTGGLADVFNGAREGLKKLLDQFKKTDDVDEFAEKTSVLERIFGTMAGVLDRVGPAFKKAGELIGDALKFVGEKIGAIFGELSLDRIIELIQGGLIIAVLGKLKDFFKQFNKLTQDADGVVKKVKGILDGVRGSVVEYQKSIKANTLLKIAAAMGILAAAILVISTIDPDALARSLAALAALFAELFGSMAIFEAATKGDFNGIRKLGLSMVVLSVSILILATAMEKIKDLSWEEIGKGLATIAALMLEMVGSAKLLENTTGFTGAATGILILSVALIVLAKAVEKMGNLEWETIGKGLAGIAAGLGIVAGGMKIMPKDTAGKATGVLILSAALLVLASAVEKMGNIEWEIMGRGLAGIAGALIAIGVSFQIMPSDMMSKATGVLILSAALLVLGNAMGNFGEMSWEEIGKSMVVLAGSLTIMAIAMNVCTSALPGAAAMLIMATSILVLTPALLAFGNLSLEQIGKSMLMLAGVFAVFGVAGLVLGPLAPVMLALAAAVLVLGVGVAAAGVGLLAFSAGLAALAASGAAGAKALETIVLTLIGLIPKMLSKVAEGLVEFAKVITNNMPTIMNLFRTLLAGIIEVITSMIPQLVEALVSGLLQMIQAIASRVPEFVQAGWDILLGFLTGIRNNIGELATVAMEILAEFVRGLGAGIGEVIDAGVQFIIDFINSIADAVDAHAAEVGAAGGRLAVSLVQGVVKGIFAGIGEVVQAAKDLAQSAVDTVKRTLDINSPSKVMIAIAIGIGEGLRDGILKSKTLPIEALKDVGNQLMEVLKETFKMELPTTLLDSMLAINDTMKESMKEVVAEAKNTVKETKEALKEAETALKDWQKVQKGVASTNKTVKEAKQDYETWRKELAITKQRTHYQNLLNQAQANGTEAQIAAAQATLDRFDAEQARIKEAEEYKALQKEIKLAKKKEAADKKKLKADIAKAKAAKKAADKEAARVAKAQKELEEFTKKTIVPFEKELAAAEEQQVALTEQIEEAAAAYEKAKNEANDYKESVKQAFTNAAKLTAQKNVRTTQQYLDSLQDTLDQALEYEEDIQKLIDLGLSQEAIDDIMSQGMETASATVKYLLDGATEESIAQVNEMIKKIEDVGDRLGTNMSDQFYKAGVDAAEGLLKGLESKLESLEKTMATIANKLAEAMKKALQIKSPSRVMYKISGFAMDGLIGGMLALQDKLYNTGKSIAQTMIDSMGDLGNILDGTIEYSPTITPLLDLSRVKHDMAGLDKIIDMQRFKANMAMTPFQNQKTSDEAPVSQVINNNATAINNFNDRIATPVEIYNATKFGVKGVLNGNR